ncbi:hypothetical protein Bca52824_046214 [Brassica carinata]|uniref:Uncharacterized protein n=1 Tax=Brassica carinata TaxID=52824 RepID=A0A8X7RE18_BRACI|nr:hypothetical protein Bca52824_046214 [Brassica carinata]
MEVSIHICIRFVSLCSGSFGPERCNGFCLDNSPRCGLNANVTSFCDYLSAVWLCSEALSTHLSLVLNLQSSSQEELFYLSAFVIVVYHFNQRRWYISSFYCNRKN